ncbi:MAG: SH3 domain-containing protein [Synergistaceae bacterium]|nr:SH3 domain-containing protein [Synergistaceae bacterium]
MKKISILGLLVLSILAAARGAAWGAGYVRLSVAGTNVNVRASANTGSKVLTQVSPGDEFIAWDDPVTNHADGSKWYKIVMPAGNGYKPLAADKRFGTAVAYISANFVRAAKLSEDENKKIAGLFTWSEAEAGLSAAKVSTPDEFFSFIETIFGRDLDFVPVVLAKLKGLPAPIPDEAIDAFITFQVQACQGLDAVVSYRDDPDNIAPALKNKLAAACMYIWYMEGDGYAQPDIAAVGEALAGMTGPEYAAYFALMNKLKEGNMIDPFSDAALVIPWDDLSDSIVWMLDFCGKYPDFGRAPIVRAAAKNRSRVYLTGIDNSPVYDFETKMIEEEVKNSYIRFTSAHPNSELAPVVARVLDVWKKNGYKYDEKVGAYLDSLKF